ncbi:hypothetical protein EDB83DRAFT_1241652 [Lactarius deliciosus]|nr:hypothetical protein EDB83DRAFT_1241652 [Lactarius deliciosus]
MTRRACFACPALPSTSHRVRTTAGHPKTRYPSYGESERGRSYKSFEQQNKKAHMSTLLRPSRRPATAFFIRSRNLLARVPGFGYSSFTVVLFRWLLELVPHRIGYSHAGVARGFERAASRHTHGCRVLPDVFPRWCAREVLLRAPVLVYQPYARSSS